VGICRGRELPVCTAFYTFLSIEEKIQGMKRGYGIFTGLYLSIPLAAAQITGPGTDSVPGLISHVLGIELSQPYQALGLAATVGVLWVSTYVIFKIGIKKIDEGIGDGHGSPLADSLGVSGSGDRNLLAALTLLIVLTTVGTGAFMGLVSGWQSLIILAFTLMLLAGLLLLLIGGAGGILGMTAYTAGKSAKVTAEGVEELQDQIGRIGAEEEKVDDIETAVESEESDVESGEDGPQDGDGSGEDSSGTDEAGPENRDYTEQEIEDILLKVEKASKLLEDIEDRIGRSAGEELEELRKEIEALEELAEILGTDKGETHERFRELLKRITGREDVEKILSMDPSGFEDLLGEASYSLDSEDREFISSLLEKLDGIEESISNLDEVVELYERLEELIDHLQEELEKIESEEGELEDLISSLESARRNRDILEELEYEKEELRKIEDKLRKIRELKDKLEGSGSTLDSLIEEIGGLDEIREAIARLRKLLNAVLDHEEDFSSTEFIGFSRESDVYPVERMKIVSPGSGVAVRFDKVMEYDGDSSSSTNPIRVSGNILDIVKALREELKKRIKEENQKESRVKTGKDEILDFIIELLGETNSEMLQRSSNLETSGIDFSRAVEEQVFDGEILNCIYLGFLVEEFKSVYLGEVVDSENSSKIGTWRNVREVVESLEAGLVNYGGSPAILLEAEGRRFVMEPESGGIRDSPDSGKIGEIRYTYH
jgi:hypothetical protein